MKELKKGARRRPFVLGSSCRKYLGVSPAGAGGGAPPHRALQAQATSAKTFFSAFSSFSNISSICGSVMMKGGQSTMD